MTDQPIYRCPRCGSTDFKSDHEAMNHFLAASCSPKVCWWCMHPKFCDCQSVEEGLRILLKEMHEENARLREELAIVKITIGTSVTNKFEPFATTVVMTQYTDAA